MSELRSAAAAHVESRSHHGEAEAIGQLIAAAQAAAGSGMSLREIADVIDTGAREGVANGAVDPGVAEHSAAGLERAA